jgi:aldose 1-epimerase
MPPLVLGTPPGLELGLLPWGATVQRLVVACGDGQRRNVVLGYPSGRDYATSPGYLGATIGRFANRIAEGSFPLGPGQVQVTVNDRGNALHGGAEGFDRRAWTVEQHDEVSASLSLISRDGDQGFPGELKGCVTYEVCDDTVDITFRATTSAPTVVSLTNHAYFNLNGEGSGCVLEHDLAVHADWYLPVDRNGLPLGALATVDGTPLDLRQARPLEEVIASNHPQIALCGGLDHCFAPSGLGLRPVARLRSVRTRTVLEVSSDLPGLQVYTGNSLGGGARSTSGRVYRRWDGIALEPEYYPDSPNHPQWPSPMVTPDTPWTGRIRWRFVPEGSE